MLSCIVTIMAEVQAKAATSSVGQPVQEPASQWVLEPVSDEEVQALVDAYAPIKDHELLVSMFQDAIAEAEDLIAQAKDTDSDNIPHPKRHNLEPFRDSSKTRVLRFWLNVIFMIGAIAGLVVYFYVEEKEAAKWILVVSCVFKFVELALRILKI